MLCYMFEDHLKK